MSTLLAVIDSNGYVHAATEVETTATEGFVRLLGSWSRNVAPCLKLSDIYRVVPVDVSSWSLTEWAEERGYRMAGVTT